MQYKGLCDNVNTAIKTAIFQYIWNIVSLMAVAPYMLHKLILYY